MTNADTRYTESVNYMIQLDGLRAMAILLVLVQHFSPLHSLFGSAGLFPVGLVGVDLFFVLSGFLITRILLSTKRRDEPLESSVVRFMYRRALRLFPIYYLVLCVAMVFNYYDAREIAGWLFSYTSNFLGIRDGHPTWGFTQFWSLAVEEQFYLVWPWIVLMIPREHLGKVFFALFASGPVSRLLVVLSGGSDCAIRFSTFCLFDLFGAGALLAWMHETGMTEARERLLKRGMWVGLGLITVAMACRLSKLPGISSNAVVMIPISFVGSLVWARAIHACSKRSSSWAGRALESAPLVYVGKISYGIYVYHNFVKDLLPKAFVSMGLAWPEIFAVQFVLLIFVTVVLSSLSWFLIEKPLNGLKNRGHVPAGAAKVAAKA